MSWRNIVITTPARLGLELGNIVIKREKAEAVSVPLDDIGVIVVETNQANLTAGLLTALVNHGVSVLFCDQRHLPCGQLLPYQQHCRVLKTLNLQLELTLPFRKNCWRLIVKRKILNQAACLDLLWLPGGDDLRRIAGQVKSGDADNRESHAALLYFSRLMPMTTRRKENPQNAALNYGYAVLRAAVARALAGHGFLPSLGLCHHSELNPFNLADDFLEVFRPTVDLWMASTMKEAEEFTMQHRHTLVGLLNCDTLIGNERQTLLHATEIMAASFLSACLEKSPGLIRMPELMPLTEHDRD